MPSAATVHAGALETNVGRKPTGGEVSGVTAGDIAAAEGKFGPPVSKKKEESLTEKVKSAVGGAVETLVVPGKGLEAAGELLHQTTGVPRPNELANDVAEGAIGLVKPIATKLTLYAVLIFGAVGFIVFGVSKMLEPVGGPNLKRAITGAAVGAAAA